MRRLVAAFPEAEAALKAAHAARQAEIPVVDAFTPFPHPELMALVGGAPAGLRRPMALAGFGVALAAFLLQAWSAVYAYPFNEGGRPLFSWPVFLLVPFEVGVLAAGVCGFVLFLVRCGFPRLHHPLFDVPGMERASQDRVLLVLDPLDEVRAPVLRTLLFRCGAVSVSEAEL